MNHVRTPSIQALYGLTFVLILASAFVVALPPTITLAADCSADCGQGQTINITGATTCSCTDFQGCTWTKNGKNFAAVCGGAPPQALNRVSMPKREDDVRHYQRFGWKLSGVQHQLIRSFKDLSKKSNEDALILIERVEKNESKTFGLLGILYGLRDLSLSPELKQSLSAASTNNAND